MDPVYLDYNATTPIAPEVAEAIRPCLGGLFGNPSSGHLYGRQARLAVDRARGQVSSLLGCSPSEIVFTSGGTESNNFALKGAAFANRDKGRHIVTTAVEHPAVLNVFRFLEARGFEAVYLPVDGCCVVDREAFRKALKPGTVLVSVMHANNEVGTIEPVAELAEEAHARGAVFHTDAAQTAGKVPVRADELGADLISIAGHKLYAPKGVGALYVREGTVLEKFMHGAGHERGMRAGTENLIGIVGLGAACELAQRDLEKNAAAMKAARDRLLSGLREIAPGARVNMHPEKCLPNTLNISFPGIAASELLSRMEGLAASGGAACHSDSIEISHVLAAMKVPLNFAMGTVRFSTGKDTTAEEIDRAIKIIAAALKSF